MASRMVGFGWMPILFAVVGCAASLAAQGRTGVVARVRGGEQKEESSELTSSAAATPATVYAVIQEMSQASGIIFAGQVTAVRRPSGVAGSSEDAAEGIVEVDLLVEQRVQGPAAGSVYTVREWSGLWNANGGGARYRVGQRLLMFLYAPDAQGLSSPVHGRDGAVPLRGGGVAPGPDDTTSDRAQWMVDLRWLQARALRGSALVLPPIEKPVLSMPVRGFAGEGGMVHGAADSGPDVVRRISVPVPVSGATTAPVETQTLAQVLALCQQGSRRVHAAR